MSVANVNTNCCSRRERERCRWPSQVYGSKLAVSRLQLIAGRGCRLISGFTLIEVLVVIAIIGVLLALLLPAVQSARESSRRTLCANNLHQLAVAANLHEAAHRIFPTGGWGAAWVGDPNLGFDPKQPGGWVYNILPYIEEESLRELGKGLAGAEKQAALSQLLLTPIDVFNCPSRRLPRAYPYAGASALQNIVPPTMVAKSDYAINAEVSYEKSEVTTGDIQHARGLSKTILVGEKTVQQSHYKDGHSPGDTLTMYIGDCDDIRRTANGVPASDAESGTGFGSAHPDGCNVAMCDGTVRFVTFVQLLQP